MYLCQPPLTIHQRTERRPRCRARHPHHQQPIGGKQRVNDSGVTCTAACSAYTIFEIKTYDGPNNNNNNKVIKIDYALKFKRLDRTKFAPEITTTDDVVGPLGAAQSQFHKEQVIPIASQEHLGKRTTTFMPSSTPSHGKPRPAMKASANFSTVEHGQEGRGGPNCATTISEGNWCVSHER